MVQLNMEKWSFDINDTSYSNGCPILLSYMKSIKYSKQYYLKKHTNHNTTIVFLTLVTVIIFHILWVTGTIKKIKPKSYILQMKLTSFLFYSKTHHNPQTPKLKTKHLEGSFFDTYDETREPLLSPT